MFPHLHTQKKKTCDCTIFTNRSCSKCTVNTTSIWRRRFFRFFLNFFFKKGLLRNLKHRCDLLLYFGRTHFLTVVLRLIINKTNCTANQNNIISSTSLRAVNRKLNRFIWNDKVNEAKKRKQAAVAIFKVTESQSRTGRVSQTVKGVHFDNNIASLTKLNRYVWTAYHKAANIKDFN